MYTKFHRIQTGARSTTLSALDIARKDLVVCKTSDNLLSVANAMVSRNVGSVLVDDGHDIVGIITKNDLLRAYLSGKSWKDTAALSVMSHPVATCNAEDTIDAALEKFQNTHYSRLAVKDKTGKIVAVVKRKIVERFIRVSAAHDIVSRRARASALPRPG